MDDAQQRALRRIQESERRAVHYRQGRITALSPLSVAVGASATAYTSVKSLVAGLVVDDVVSILTFDNDAIIIGRVGGPTPMGAYAGVSRVAGTSYQPSTARPVLVIATLTIACPANTVGRWDVKCDAANPPTSIIASPYHYYTGTVDSRIRFPVTFTVPPGHYYKFDSVAETGTPSFAISSVVESIL